MGADASKLQQQHLDNQLQQQQQYRHGGKPTLQHSLSLDMPAAACPVPVPPHPSLATTPSVGGKKKKDYHYSDFSLFPDRFSAPPKAGKEVQPLAMSKSVNEGGFLSLPPEESLSTSVSDPIGFTGRVGNFSNQLTTDQQKADFEKFRRRVNSQGTNFSASPSRDSSPKLLYFDFSMIPEKDPRSFERKTTAKAAEAEGVVRPPQRQRLFSVGDEQMMMGKVAEQVAETAEAQKLHVQSSSSRVRKTSEPPRFSFFDYSLIPDKMDSSVKAPTSKAK